MSAGRRQRRRQEEKKRRKRRMSEMQEVNMTNLQEETERRG